MPCIKSFSLLLVRQWAAWGQDSWMCFLVPGAGTQEFTKCFSFMNICVRMHMSEWSVRVSSLPWVLCFLRGGYFLWWESYKPNSHSHSRKNHAMLAIRSLSNISARKSVNTWDRFVSFWFLMVKISQIKIKCIRYQKWGGSSENYLLFRLYQRRD